MLQVYEFNSHFDYETGPTMSCQSTAIKAQLDSKHETQHYDNLKRRICRWGGADSNEQLRHENLQ